MRHGAAAGVAGREDDTLTIAKQFNGKVDVTVLGRSSRSS
jgi:hypothetical protein